jgi:hypothetical protein
MGHYVLALVEIILATGTPAISPPKFLADQLKVTINSIAQRIAAILGETFQNKSLLFTERA